MRYRVNIRRLIAGIIVVLFICIFLAGAVYLYEKRDQRGRAAKAVRQEEESLKWSSDNTMLLDGDTYGFDHRIESFLFMGTDANGSEAETGLDYHGAMADFLLLMVLDYTDDTYGCFQIDRNTITRVNEMDETGKMTDFRQIKICVSHWYGGDRDMSAVNTMDSVKYLLGDLERIDGYYVLSMGDIGALNHAVGGVEITMNEDLTAADPAFTKGSTLTLTDEQAERFVRARMTVGEGTNAERMARQKEYMDVLLQKIKSNSMEDAGFALRLWNALRSAAATDMKGMDFSRIANMFIKGQNKGILSPEGETRIGTVLNDGLEHEEFYPDETSLLEVMRKLYSLKLVDS